MNTINTKVFLVPDGQPLPPDPVFLPGIRRAPRREGHLSQKEKAMALKNALRYIPERFHEQMAKEFLIELEEHGKIYGYRFRPEGRIYGKPIDAYKGQCVEGKAFQVMIDNNLDFEVALYPYELITYGETGAVCQNWMQYCLIKEYLEILTNEQTLVLFSGHPVGLFHSPKTAPRVILTNGLLIGQYDNLDDYNRASAMGVSSYGQMTAGGFMYIGPQGIVHGTYNTLLNAGRNKLGIPQDQDLAGHLFVSSGLGGMSGAQGKACNIAGGVSIIAEVDRSRIHTRHEQGWVDAVSDSLEEVYRLAQEAMNTKMPLAIAYHGNIVDLLEYAIEHAIPIDLLSDQTSCHEPYTGGYCPQGLTFDERTKMLAKNPEQSGVKEISKNKENDRDGFIWPSYVEDIMGPLLFDYGYGPFRWVCLSGKDEDLQLTDEAAMSCIDPDPVMIGRDHHDTGGTDSPFRETSNIYDGSNVTADMATSVFAGNAARGMSLCALHNGGGTGIGKAINGGFGCVLDGSERIDEVLRNAVLWDVMAGVARRAWARNEHAIETVKEYNAHMAGRDLLTLPYIADDHLIEKTMQTL